MNQIMRNNHNYQIKDITLRSITAIVVTKVHYNDTSVYILNLLTFTI